MVDFHGWNWRIPGFDENKIQHWALFSTTTNQGRFYFHWAYNLEFARTKRFAKTVGSQKNCILFNFELFAKFRFLFLGNFALFFREIFAFLIKRKFRILLRNRLKRNFVKKRKFSPFLRAKEIRKNENFRETIFPIRYKPLVYRVPL